MRDLTVAVIQDAIDWRKPGANRNRFAARLDETGPVDLAVLPEMFATGFTMTPAGVAEPPDGPSVTWLRSQARERGCAIAGSLAIEENGRYFNRLFVAGADGSLTHYDKRHLFRMAGEDARYAAGAGRVVLTLDGWRIALNVCYDLRFPVFCRNRGDYDALLFVANWPAPRHDAWSTLLRARAMENQAYCIGVNRIGVDGNGLEYLGGSVVLDFLGRPLADCESERVTRTARLDAAALAQAREKFPVALDADPFELTS